MCDGSMPTSPLADIGCERGVVQRRLQPDRARFDDLPQVMQLGSAARDVLSDGLLELGDGLPGQISEVRHDLTLCEAGRKLP